MNSEISIVRQNLLTRKGYTPYCGGECCSTMPRTFFNGKQFQCHKCDWRSNYEPEFIKQYLAVKEIVRSTCEE